MHFLEAARFLNAPDLVGRKVNFTPRFGSLGLAVGVWALKQLCSQYQLFWGQIALAVARAFSGPKKVSFFRARPFQLPA